MLSLSLLGIKTLTYPSLMANQQDGDHHNNDIDNIVLTRAEFLNFRDENHQFCEKSQRIISEMKQKIATLLARKSSHKIMTNIFKDALLTTRKFHSLREICVRWILSTGFLIWKSILIFGKFVMK